MKIDWNRKYNTIAVYAVAVLAVAATAFFLLMNIGKLADGLNFFLSIISPLVIGFIIAYLFNPLMKGCEVKLFAFVDRKKPHPRLKRALSLLTTYIVYTTIIILIFALVIPQVILSYNDLVVKLNNAVSSVDSITEAIAKWAPFLDTGKISDYLNELFSDSYTIFQNITPYITSFFASFAEQLKNAFLGIVLSVYFLYSKEKLTAQLKKLMYAVLPRERGDGLLSFLRFTDDTFGGFIIGKLLDSLIICILTFIVLAIFNMPYYQLIAVIVGVTNIIPFFGPFIGAIPSAFIILIAEPSKALWFIVIIIIIQQIDGNVIGPKILGETTGLSALGVIIAITVMSGLLGVTGMFIGVPLFALIYVLFKRFIDRVSEKKKRRGDENGGGDEV